MEKVEELYRKFKIHNDSMEHLMEECSKGNLDLLDWEVQQGYQNFKEVKVELIKALDEVVF